jgi:hypothetical protein
VIKIVNLLRAIKDKINNWIQSMAKDNEKEYGDKELSCCNLNKKEGE